MKTTAITLILIFYMGVCHAQYQHDSIKIEHGYLHYYTKGSGKPLVLLQGGPGFSSYYMRTIADSLLGYKTILVDYEGTGKSNYRKADTSWASLDNAVHNLETVRKKLKISQWTLIGHSYGGTLALYYATKYPASISKIITVDGGGTDNKFQSYYGTNIQSRFTDEDKKTVREILGSSLPENEKFTKYQLSMTSAIFYDRNKASKFISYIPADEIQRILNKDYFVSLYSELNKLDIGKEVYQLNIPIRIIHGRQDAIGEAVPVLLNERSKNSKLFFVEKAGHFPWIEQPAIFFKQLKQFLED